jgi:iron complex outermembrane receptor protein
MVQAGIGSLDTSIDELREIAGTAIGVVVGNALPFSPELQANVGLSYNANLGNGGLVTPRLDVFYQDRTYFDANNTVEIAQLESVSVVNLSVGYEPASRDWAVTLGVNNATDELYSTGGNSSLTTGSGYAEIAYARPREYFLSYRNSF